jgi:hypothetical protein
LSCRLNGSGARDCDKRMAFAAIWELSKEWVPPAGSC